MNKNLTLRLLKLFPGFFCIALGIYLMRISYLGLNPWGTFHDGISSITGLKYGTASQLTGLCIILLSMILKIYPGIGTILNMMFCGFFINVIETANLIPTPITIVMRFIYFIAGIWILAFGIYFYLSARLGAGPRDGLMVGLVRKTKFDVTVIRTSIEISVLLLGYSLGGAVGIGTVIAALLSGYSLHAIFRLFQFNPKTAVHLSLNDFIKQFTRKIE